MPISVRNSLLAVCCVTTLVAAEVSAQRVSSGTWFRRTIDRDQGLPETQVNAIAQTADAYLWLATRRGLVRYDGANFTAFTPEQHRGLPSYWIRGLTVDARDRLWIATDQGLGVREGGRFRRIDSTAVPWRVTWDVEQQGDEIWVVASTGLYRGDGTRFQRVPGVDAYLYSLQPDRAGRLWIGGRDYLGYWDGTTVRRVSPPGERPEQDYIDLADDGSGGVWAATRQGMIRLVTDTAGRTRVTQRVSATVRGIPSAVWAVRRSADGIIWIGTANHGVLMWDGEHVVQADPGNIDQVWTFHEDQRGRMWVGTGVGMERYQRSGFRTIGDGLRPTTSTWSVRADQEGRIWTATAAGDLYRLEDGQHRQVQPAARRQASPATWPAPDGGLWATREGRRILHVTSQGIVDHTSRFRLNAGDIMGIFVDSRGSTWFSTDSGVFRSTGGPAEPMSASLGLPTDDFPRDIREDAAGRLLFGRPGLTVVDGAVTRHYGEAEGLTDPQVMTILPQGDNVWIGTADSGLYVLRRGRITALGSVDPRLHQEILGIVEDTLRHLWITSSFGLSRVGTAELLAFADGRSQPVQVRSFDRQDGLPTTEFNGDFMGALHRDARGHLWLPSYLGVVEVDPGAIHADSVPPQVHLETIQVDGRSYAPGASLGLPPHVSRLEVTFAVTNALVPGRARVQYRMEGISNEWLEAGARRTLAFGPLRGGRYRLSVRASNEEGSWALVPATLDVDVAFAFYQRPWFVPALIGGAVALALLAARLRQRRLERRSRELAEEVRARTADLEAARVTLERRVEERTAQLAGELAERKRLEGQLLEAQKLESIGRLAGGVAHEINNSMTGVLGFADLATQNANGNATLLGDLGEIRRAGERVAGITRQLLAFARRQVSMRAAVDPGPLVAGLERGLKTMIGDQVRLKLDVATPLPAVRVDVAQIEQVLINLVLNARDAIRDGGTITIGVRADRLESARSVGSVVLAPSTYVHVTVSDDGVGMPPAVLARLFEPFFTTKDVHKGTGLGLAVCHGIITQHGGAIEADSVPGVGSTFHVWLPVTDEAVQVETVSVTSSPGGHETILVVEDEPAVREVARRSLTRQGYTVIEAVNAIEALQVLDTQGDRVDLVLSDVVMPEIDGLTLAQTMRSRGREMPIVFMSGYTGHARDVEEKLSTIGPMLVKPFSHEALATTIRRVLDREPRARVVPGRYQPL